MDKIIVMGDSHCDLFHNDQRRKRGQWSDSFFTNLFDCRWLGPVTFWRVCRDKNKSIDFENGIRYVPSPGCDTTTEVSKEQTLILFFGEIDIRCHIGKYGDYKNTIDDMCENMYEFLSNYKDYNIHFSSILPPMYSDKCIASNSDLPFIESDEYRSDATLYFNKKIKELCDKLNFGYFDIYPLYVDDEGMIDISKSDKIVHGIKTKDLEDYIKLYFNI